MKYPLNAFVVADPHKCIGCKVCEVACAVAHNATEARTVGALNMPLFPRLYLVRTPEVTLPVQCRQCEDAPCANACPVDAISQRQGSIVIDEGKCVGCKTCMLACPFGAIDLVPVYRNGEPLVQPALLEDGEEGWEEKGWVFASKCDLCGERPNGPACMEACPEQALELIRPQQEKKRRNQEAAQALLGMAGKYFD